MTVRVRAAVPADRDAVVALVPRLRAFGDVALRASETLDRAERETLERALEDPAANSILFVAELDDAGVGGVAYVQTGTDYFTRESHGHLAIIAVAESGEGQGIGRALLAAAEGWSGERGYRFITLNVFAGNTRARVFYERAGFAPDTLRYYKDVVPPSSEPPAS